MKISEKYYRKSFINYIGFDAGDAAHVHHTFPKQLADKFLEAGINVNDPRYLSWVEKTIHQNMHNAEKYNSVWEKFLLKNHSKEAILNKGRELAEEGGFYVDF